MTAPVAADPAKPAALAPVNPQHALVGPLCELLRVLGFETSRQALVEECADDFSLPSMARCIQRRGVLARVITAKREDLAHFGITLVELEDSRVALLRVERGGRLRFECADGAVVGDPEGTPVARAIELSAAWPDSGNFLARVFKQTMEHGRLRRGLVLFGLSLLASGGLGYVAPLVARMAVDEAIPEGAAHTLAALAIVLVLCGCYQALLGNLALLRVVERVTRVRERATA